MGRSWDLGEVAQELMLGMEQAELAAEAKEESAEEVMFVRALDELNAAAESFKVAGRTGRETEVTQVMLSLAKCEKKKVNKPKKNESSLDEAKKVLMFFGFGPGDLQGLEVSSNGDGGDGE